MLDKPLFKLELPAKVLLTLFILTLGLGYLAAVFTVYISHKDADGKPSFTMQDIVVTYYGDRESTVLETVSRGSMKTYYASDDELETVVAWIDGGADRIGYEKDVAPIFKRSCISCHSSGGSEASSPLTTYDEVTAYTAVNTGLDLITLGGLSHTHLITHALMFLGLSAIFLMTTVKDRWKIILVFAAYGAIVFDVASWWLGKLAPGFAAVSIVTGSIMGLTFVFFFFVPLYQLWLKKS